MQVLLWIGAVGVLALAFIKVGDWISRRVDIEHVSATWLIAPVGGPFVLALVAPAISTAYVEAALFGSANSFEALWCMTADFYSND